MWDIFLGDTIYDIVFIGDTVHEIFQDTFMVQRLSSLEMGMVIRSTPRRNCLHFHVVRILLGVAWIGLFSFQLWVNRRSDCAFYLCIRPMKENSEFQPVKLDYKMIFWRLLPVRRGWIYEILYTCMIPCIKYIDGDNVFEIYFILALFLYRSL